MYLFYWWWSCLRRIARFRCCHHCCRLWTLSRPYASGCATDSGRLILSVRVCPTTSHRVQIAPRQETMPMHHTNSNHPFSCWLVPCPHRPIHQSQLDLTPSGLAPAGCTSQIAMLARATLVHSECWSSRRQYSEVCCAARTADIRCFSLCRGASPSSHLEVAAP